MTNKRVVLSLLVAIILGIGVFGISQASAQTTNGNFASGLAQMIAQKFGLDQSQVQTVVNSYFQNQQANRQQKMEQRIKAKLDTEVAAGKITSAQETAIINELNSLKAQINPETLKAETPQQRQQTFQNLRTQLQAWANQQGISMSLIPGFGMGFKGGMHMRMGKWLKPSVTPTPGS